MAKTTKASGKFGAAATTTVVRSSKTGRLVEGVSLLKPIAKQALAQETRRREAG